MTWTPDRRTFATALVSLLLVTAGCASPSDDGGNSTVGNETDAEGPIATDDPMNGTETTGDDPTSGTETSDDPTNGTETTSDGPTNGTETTDDPMNGTETTSDGPTTNGTDGGTTTNGTVN